MTIKKISIGILANFQMECVFLSKVQWIPIEKRKLLYWNSNLNLANFPLDFYTCTVQFLTSMTWEKNASIQKIFIISGIIVRCIQRLNDLCCDVKNAAKCLGVKEVEIKMVEASNLLKRDIVFAASLYTQ